MPFLAGDNLSGTARSECDAPLTRGI